MTPVEVAQHLVDAGFTGWQVVTMTAIAGAESAYDPHAVHVVDSNPEAKAYRSIDMGLFQINDFWWEQALRDADILKPGLPASVQLLDPAINARAARFVWVESGDGDPHEGYEAWTTWREDLHLPFMCAAEKAAREIGVEL